MNLLVFILLFSFSTSVAVASSSPGSAAEQFKAFEESKEMENQEEATLVKRKKVSDSGVASMEVTCCKDIGRRLRANIVKQVLGQKNLNLLRVQVMASHEEAYYPDGDDANPLTDAFDVDLGTDDSFKILSLASSCSHGEGCHMFTVNIQNATANTQQAVIFKISATTLWQWYKFHLFDQQLSLVSANLKQYVAEPAKQERSCPRCVIM